MVDKPIELLYNIPILNEKRENIMNDVKVQTFENDVTAADVIRSNTTAISQREQNKLKSTELYYDIISYMSVLCKLGYENIVDNELLLVEVLNETGFRTVQGHEFSNNSYRNFMNRMDSAVKDHVKDVLKGEL